VLLDRGAAVREVDGQHGQARREACQRECGRDAAPSGDPAAQVKERDDGQHHGGEHNEVTRRVRGERERRGQRGSGSLRAVAEKAVRREQRERQPVNMDALHVCQPRQRVGVERERGARQQSGRPVARPAFDEQERRERRQREAREEDEVIDEHG
jgi:hypothetical protein